LIMIDCSLENIYLDEFIIDVLQTRSNYTNRSNNLKLITYINKIKHS
jgi:hypothetical protein